MERIEVKEVADVLRGSTPTTMATAQEGAVFIGQSEVNAGRQFEKRYVDTGGGVEGGGMVRLVSGDVVFSGLGRVHGALLIDDSLHGSVLGRECLAARMRLGDGPMSAGYLAAWARTKDFSKQVARSVTGTTMPRLTPSGLGALRVPRLSQKKQFAAEELVRRVDEATAALQDSMDRLAWLLDVDLAVLFFDGEEI